MANTYAFLALIPDWLNMIEILEMRRVCKLFTEIPVAKLFKRRLAQRIQEICEIPNIEAHRLLAVCHHRTGIISGSIILQVLFDTKYSNSDLDIFINTALPNIDTHNVVCNMLDISLNTRMNYVDKPSMDDYCNNPEIIAAPTNPHKHRFATQHDYTLLYNYKLFKDSISKRKNIQIIGINGSKYLSNHDLATNHFDLSIVSNSYCHGILEVYNLNNLIKRHGYAFRGIKYERYQKYIKRGFSIPCALSQFHSIYKMAPVLDDILRYGKDVSLHNIN